MFLEILQNSQENTYARVSFQAYNFIKKEALEISNTFSYKAAPVAASEMCKYVTLSLLTDLKMLCPMT